ncbi:pentapeptide repeat-containing protein [Actinoplanes regularis]|uniref:pentapeptide repeat-containing protein n=1 Tax=Actinoplanes regularis TaxID=52697 RepID=UPI0024A1774E|nr:pentapeptide repeat-containing protein [Actinoplanes regularis]GLW35138.1 hypothetical protein Areg01_80740 [Actinoplanes regularis]
MGGPRAGCRTPNCPGSNLPADLAGRPDHPVRSDRLPVHRDQQRLALQGQLTDRFTKAVEQLGQSGPEKIDVRLGAIYALQRIMRDSAHGQPAVVDILSAFVRVHAPAPDELFAERPALRPVDIQAALTVLARRNPDRDGEGHVDLFRTNLRFADLRGAGLRGAGLRGAGLRGLDLRGVHLGGADLGGATLYGAHLSGADLHGAHLGGVDLRGVDLDPEQLRCTYIDEDTVLPLGTVRPMPKAPTGNPQCKPGG